MLLSDTLNKINAAIAKNLNTLQDQSFHGLTILKERDGKTSPYEKTEEGDGIQISPEDTHDLQIYYRETGNSQEVNTSSGFGNKLQRRVTHTVELIALAASSFYDYDSWQISNMIGNAIPHFTGKGEFVNITSFNANTVEVLNEEFRGHQIDHLMLDINAIKITLEIIKIYC